MRNKDALPITFTEWGYLGKGRFQRCDFRLDVLARYQIESGNDILNLDSPEAIAYNRQGQSRAVFRVVKNQPKPRDIASVEYRGTVYSLPLEAQGYSATTLMVLNQLFSLSKSVNSIPSTGTVVVR